MTAKAEAEAAAALRELGATMKASTNAPDPGGSRTDTVPVLFDKIPVIRKNGISGPVPVYSAACP